MLWTGDEQAICCAGVGLCYSDKFCGSGCKAGFIETAYWGCGNTCCNDGAGTDSTIQGAAIPSSVFWPGFAVLLLLVGAYMRFFLPKHLSKSKPALV